MSVAMGHGFSLDEVVVRVPLILAGDDVPKVAVPEQVRHVDLLPTLTELCDIRDGRHCDGRSLQPLLQGGRLPEEPAYMEAVGIRLSGRHIVGARTSEWKLLKEADGRRRLHNLTDGPLQQKRNLYGRFPDVAHRLEDYIEAVNSQAISAPEMTPSDEVLLEKHLRALGYLE